MTEFFEPNKDKTPEFRSKIDSIQMKVTFYRDAQGNTYAVTDGFGPSRVNSFSKNEDEALDSLLTSIQKSGSSI